MSTKVFDDTFVRADSLPGSPGNGWLDADSFFYIHGNKLANSADDSGAAPGHWCLRPALETNKNQAAVFYVKLMSTHDPAWSAAAGISDSVYILLRADPVGKTAYRFSIVVSNGTINIQIINGSSYQIPVGFVSGAGAPWAPPTTALHEYIIVAEAFSADSTHTVCTLKLYDAANTTTPLATLQTGSDTFAGTQIQGQIGVYAGSPDIFAITQSYLEYQTWNYDGAADPTLTALGVFQPTPALASVGTTTASLTASAATTSGTPASLTYQWYRAADPSIVPGAVGSTLIASATSLTLNDAGLTPSTLYWYRLRATDSTLPVASQTGDSSAIAVYTYSAAKVYSILGIGDSIMANRPKQSVDVLGFGTTTFLTLETPIALTARYLEKLTNNCQVLVFNGAQGGLASSDYLPLVTGLPASSYTLSPASGSGTNLNVNVGGSGPGTNLLLALQGGLALSTPPTHCIIQLGANDSNPSHLLSQATYQANLQNICRAVKGNGMVPVVCPPSFIQVGADQIWALNNSALAQSYLAAVQNLVAAGECILGDFQNWYWMSRHTDRYFTAAIATPNLGVHCQQDGVYALAEVWGRSLALAMGLYLPPRIGTSLIGSGT